MYIFSELIGEDYAHLWDDSNEGTPDTPRKQHEKVLMKCLNGEQHSFWVRMDRLPTSKSKCPICTKKTLYPEYNSVAALHPEVVRTFSAKNKTIAEQTLATQSKMLYWKCEKHGTEYRQSLRGRLGLDGRPGCQECWKYSISVGFKYPEIAADWDYEKNTKSPFEVSAYNNKCVNWICSLGHRYTAQINDRTSRNNGCPVCGGKKVVSGFNDLQSQFPDIAAEFDEAKNRVAATEVYCKSGLSFWWRCSTNSKHTWNTRINHRTIAGTNCPKCVSRTSVAENELFHILKKWIPDLEQGRRDLLERTLEVDLYSEKLRVGVEFCGVYWHNPSKFPKVHAHDTEKRELAERNGFTLFTVWEDFYEADPEGTISRLLACVKENTRSSEFELDRAWPTCSRR